MAQFKEMWELLEKYRFEVDTKLLVHVKCVICEKILIDAHEGLCGCNYCLKCITKYLQGGTEKCPGDSVDCKLIELILYDNITRSNSTNRKISKLKVNCPSNNCNFESELHAMNDHLRICDRRSVNCPYLEIGCPKSPVPIDKISSHLISDIHKHAQLLVDWVINTKNEISLSSSSEKLENLQINKYEMNIDTLHRDLHDLNAKYTEIINELKTIKYDHEIEIKQLKILIGECQNHDSSKSLLGDKSITKQNNQNDEKISAEENLPDDLLKQEDCIVDSLLKIEELDKTSEHQLHQTTTFTWTITDIARKKKKNVVIDSENFFSKKDDLKMRLDFYNGNKNKIRIRFYVISGNNKNSKSKSNAVTITIMDFNNPDASQSLSKTCDFSIQKLKSFYEIFEFLISDLEQRKVLQSDAILIECAVDTEIN